MDTNPAADRNLQRLANTEWLREAADRHERRGETAWALLYRSDAARIEEEYATLAKH
jgi:hypothetical protein